MMTLLACLHGWWMDKVAQSPSRSLTVVHELFRVAFRSVSHTHGHTLGGFAAGKVPVQFLVRPSCKSGAKVA